VIQFSACVPDKSEQTNPAKRSTARLTWSRPCLQFRGCFSIFIAALALAARPLASRLLNPAMEEAASLFGPADSASDPFGSIVTNGGDDFVASSTSPPSELPHSDTREANTGGNWHDGVSNHYQPEGSLHPEYDWRSSDGTGHYSDNFQPQYQGSTPSNFTDSHPISPYVGDNLQYTASHDGEWPSTFMRLVMVSQHM
jgi:hypothetical protein